MVQNLKIFIFASNVTSRKIPKRWLRIWQEYFQISAPKYGNLAFLFPNFKDFYFCPKLAIRQIRGRWLQIWQWLFEIAAQNTQITHLELNANRSFLVPSLFFFSFWMKVYSFPNSRVLIESFISLIKSFKTFEGADFRHKFNFFFVFG